MAFFGKYLSAKSRLARVDKPRASMHGPCELHALCMYIQPDFHMKSFFNNLLRHCLSFEADQLFLEAF